MLGILLNRGLALVPPLLEEVDSAVSGLRGGLGPDPYLMYRGRVTPLARGGVLLSCYHPLLGIPKGVDPKSGKMQYHIKPWPKNFTGDPYAQGLVTIPCGKCVGCRLDYSRQWANRCMLELQYHDVAWFITLTYAPAFVPVTFYDDEATGEAMQVMTLRKRDLQLFFKRLRRAYPDDKIRYFAAGEYGDKNMRPHYHAIVYGLHLDDLKPAENFHNDFQYFSSRKLQEVWNKGLDNTYTAWYNDDGSRKEVPELASRGMIVIAPVTWETCAYVARYVMKKQSGPASEVYTAHNIEKPFSLMSRKPGIGRQYYDDHPNLYDYEYINIATEDGGRKFRPPKYFDKLRLQQCPDEAQRLRDFRKSCAENTRDLKLTQTDNEYLEMLKVEEDTQAAKIKSMERSF